MAQTRCSDSYSSVQKQMGTKNAISILKEKIKIPSVLSAEELIFKCKLRKFFNLMFEYIGNIRFKGKCWPLSEHNLNIEKGQT